jgi:hypothetical protein
LSLEKRGKRKKAEYKKVEKINKGTRCKGSKKNKRFFASLRMTDG